MEVTASGLLRRSATHWVPPFGLLFAQASHGASWAALAAIALTVGIDGLTLPAIAWIHLVALGWFTVAALSILLHVIPGFTDLTWRFERVARLALWFFAGGVVAFVASLSFNVRWSGASASLVVAALCCYLACAFATLARAGTVERTERAVARALAMTLVVLLVVALLGLLLALFLSGTMVAAWIARLPAAHANLGIYGWLSLLVYGVSVRTLRPISGARSRLAWAHIAVGSATLLGAPVLAAGLAAANESLAWLGAALIAGAAIVYVADAGDTLARATVPHRPPQAFVAAALAWLLVAIVLGGLALAGRPVALAYGFVALIGWVGQMVNAHMLHIGTRVVTTLYRGDEDETRPGELLDPRASWTSFALFQTAIALVAIGLLAGARAFVACGAAAGLAAWLVTLANLAIVTRRLR